MRAFVTGATGLVGSHIAEHLIGQGDEVVALVRPTSDTSFLQQLGVHCVQGDLSDLSSLRRGMIGTDVVFHAAAKVSDWGAWSEFQRVTINGTYHVLEAMRAAGVSRIVHISSVTVYGHEAYLGGVYTEDAPYATHFLSRDYYTAAKIAAEKLVIGYHRKEWVNATVIRPAWVYGPRDRTSFPRMVRFLKDGLACLIGSGDNELQLVYAGSLAEACILAATHDAASGRVYNASQDYHVTQRRYMNALTQSLGLKPVTRCLPPSAALAIARVSEISARLLRRKDPPLMSLYGIYIITNRGVFDSTRAHEELGWRSSIGFEEGLARTIEWFERAYMRQSGSKYQPGHPQVK